MVDDYGGYKKLFDGTVTEGGCWAHARLKFFDLHTANQSPMAAEALRRIGLLFAIEARGRDMSVHEPQACFRRKACPCCKRCLALRVYADSGNLPIDNNPLENSIRPIALGKKNWLFAGSERAGRRAAATQNLLGTAKLNGIDPLAWLTEVLEKLPTWKNHRLGELLPLRREAADQKEDKQAR